MKSELLIAIRQSKKRMVPAINSQQKKRPFREQYIKYLRVLSPLTEIPLKIDKTSKYFLGSVVRINSKSNAVIEEFRKNGANQQLIWNPSKESGFPIRLVRILYLLPRVIIILTGAKKALRIFNLTELQVFIGYLSYKSFFLKHKQVIPIIISDISPKLHMQWSAAVAIGRDVLWWQDDYHHMMGFSSENYMPYPATMAAVLNQGGFKTAIDKNPNAKIFLRNQTTVKPIKDIPEKPRIGLATNAFFEANKRQIRLLQTLKEKMNSESYRMRLHPNSKLTEKSFPPGLVDIAPLDESIEEFANRVDIVVVGNSAVQLRLLCEGVPVIHIAGLDKSNYDVYGYKTKGFVYGSFKLSNISMLDIRSFYRDRSLMDRINDYVNVKDKNKTSPLSHLTK